MVENDKIINNKSLSKKLIKEVINYIGIFKLYPETKIIVQRQNFFEIMHQQFDGDIPEG